MSKLEFSEVRCSRCKMGMRYDATVCPYCRTEATLGELAKRKSERRDTFMGAIAALVIGAGAIAYCSVGNQNGRPNELEHRREAAVQKCLEGDKFGSLADCRSKVEDAFDQRRNGMIDALAKFNLCANAGTGCPDANSFDLPNSCKTSFEAAGLALYFADASDRKRKWAEVEPTQCIDEMALWKLQAKPVFDALEIAAKQSR